MEKLFDKFNVFDIFTMLIPGLIIATLLGISLSEELSVYWGKAGGEKYFVFVAISYFIGIVLHEMGTFIDILSSKNKKPREVFLIDKEEVSSKKKSDKETSSKKSIRKKFSSRIIDEPAFFNDLTCLKDKMSSIVGIKTSTDDNKKDSRAVKTSNKAEDEAKEARIDEEKKSNALFYGYCLSICEYNGLSTKAEKMTIISEMSRSLSLGCAIVAILDFTCLIGGDTNTNTFYVSELFVLVGAVFLLWYRKNRYERYSMRILLRNMLLYSKNVLEQKKSDETPDK